MSPSLVLAGFGHLHPDTVSRLVRTAADVALLLDEDGVVREALFRNDALRAELADGGDWVGRFWRTAMTVESRPKFDAMLADAASTEPVRWRQLNHPAVEGVDVAISWSAVPADRTTVLLGRDLRQVAALQQRLVETQQFLERDYLALRRTEARFRILFDTATDGLAVLDAATLRPLELNPAARSLLGRDARRAAARPFADCFDGDRTAILERLAAARAGGQPPPVDTAINGSAVRLTVSGLREEEGWFLLARLGSTDAAPAEPVPEAGMLPDLLAAMPDAAVLTCAAGNVTAANDAFRSLAGLGEDQAVAGQPLSRWVGQDGVDLSVLINNLEQRGAVRLFPTALHGEDGVRTEVEISASLRPGGVPGFAFYLRDVGRRPTQNDRTQAGRIAPRAAEGVGALIGRVPLKELVRDSTDAIERLCIESALEMTGNNRASAAEMLGLSRQSLYVKLRRFGMVDTDAADGADAAPP